MPPAALDATRRITQNSRPTSNRVGPKPTSNCCQIGAGASGGLAFTGTLLACSIANRLSAANDGRCVVNRSTCTVFPVCPLVVVGVYAALLVNSPSIVSPVEVISETFFACTWVRKYVYDTGVRAGGASRND